MRCDGLYDRSARMPPLAHRVRRRDAESGGHASEKFRIEIVFRTVMRDREGDHVVEELAVMMQEGRTALPVLEVGVTRRQPTYAGIGATSPIAELPVIP